MAKKGKTPHRKMDRRRQVRHSSMCGNIPGALRDGVPIPEREQGFLGLKDPKEPSEPLGVSATAGEDYIRFFNEEWSMCRLSYVTSKQFGEESMKANPHPLPPDQCLHFPMIVYKT